MLGFPLGILSAAGAGELGSYDLIQTHIVSGTATASVLFDSLATYASDYKYLQLRMTGRTTRTGSDSDFFGVRFNGDSGNNYANHNIGNSGASSVSSFFVTSQTDKIFVERIAATDATANVFGAVVLDIADPYSTTKNTTVRFLGGVLTSSPFIRFASGMFINTAAISSISVFAGTNNLLAGSRISLYGIRGE